MGIREIREQARGSLHAYMGRPILYYPDHTDTDAFVESKARAHSKRGQIGDLPGTNLNYAEVIDRVERVVLWRADIPAPMRGGLIVFSATEGYWIESVDPPDGQTVKVNVISATEAELVGIPAPAS